MYYIVNPICAENWDTYRQFRKFCRFSRCKNRYYKTVSKLTHLAFGLLITAYILGFVFNYLSYGLVWIGLLIPVSYLLYLAMVKITPEMLCLEAERSRGSYCEYVFSQENILISYGIDKAGRRKETKQYGDIVKVYEMDNEFYIFWDKKNAAIIEKDKFTSGNPETLRALLSDRAGTQKYVTILK